MQANRNIHLCLEKHPFTSYPAAKHPKYSNFDITDMREKPADFFLLYDTGIDFSSHNNFFNLGSFAKVSVPVGSIAPCPAVSVNAPP